MNKQWRIWLPVVAALAVVLAARYAWVQPAAIGQLCDSGGGPWWCVPRQWLILSFATKAIGYAALGLGILALFSRHCGIAVIAACVGVAALILYNYELGAVGFTLSVLTLARLAQRPQPAIGH